MVKIVIGVVTALLLAACTDMAPVSPTPQVSGMTSGVGHPDPSYPGPRLY